MKAEEPIAFSEEELDEEISMSMKSGNASQEEIDMVFQRNNQGDRNFDSR